MHRIGLAWPVRACHRCLLSHISDDKFALVSRVEALRMLNELLDGWVTASVADTGRISLWDQARMPAS